MNVGAKLGKKRYTTKKTAFFFQLFQKKSVPLQPKRLKYNKTTKIWNTISETLNRNGRNDGLR